MTSGFQLSILTPSNDTATTQLLPRLGRYVFINVLPGGTVLTGFLWSPQYCTLCCTVCRETLQKLKLGGRKNYDWESNCGCSLFTRFFFKLLMCISDCLHSPTGVSQPIAKWFQGLFLELACLLKNSTTHTGCTSNAHSTISNPQTPGPT